jgi:hypothetical protein
MLNKFIPGEGILKPVGGSYSNACASVLTQPAHQFKTTSIHNMLIVAFMIDEAISKLDLR